MLSRRSPGCFPQKEECPGRGSRSKGILGAKHWSQHRPGTPRPIHAVLCRRGMLTVWGGNWSCETRAYLFAVGAADK